MESRVEQAVERFKKGCNCAQAVFVTYADRFGLDEGTAMKLSSPFGGGLAGMRHVCGTVSGMSCWPVFITVRYRKARRPGMPITIP